MIYFANTLKDLRAAVDSMIKVVGEDAPVGVEFKLEKPETWTRLSPAGPIEGRQVEMPAGDYISDQLALEWVMVDKETGHVVGTEADDYEKKPNEAHAVRLG